MKRPIFFALSVLFSVCVYGENVTEIESTNTVGMTRLNSSLSELPIGVVYGGFAVSNLLNTVSNLLWTGNLVGHDKSATQADRLFVYDDEIDAYRNFLLNANGTWRAVTPGEYEKIEADKIKLAYGRGVWLERKNISTRADKNVYIYGQVPIGKITTIIKAGGEKKATSTLISFPISEPLDVNDSSVVNWDGVAEKGDHIRFYDSNGKASSYNWLAKQKKWYYEDDEGEPVTEGLILPRGQAFWYQRAAGKSATSIVWNIDAVGTQD